jgi:hypothetical protein
MKSKKIALLLTLSVMLTAGITACAGGDDAPAKAVELYHEALVAKDQDLLVNYACADWETQALLELDSFVSVETALVDMACQTVSEDGSSANVECTGSISATYNGEAREFPLSGRTFIVTEEGGEWRLCGYK